MNYRKIKLQITNHKPQTNFKGTINKKTNKNKNIEQIWRRCLGHEAACFCFEF